MDGTVAFGTEGVFGRAGSFRYGALWTKSKMEIRGKFSLHGAILVAISNGTCRRSAGRTIDNFRCSLCNHRFLSSKHRFVSPHQMTQELASLDIRTRQKWRAWLERHQATNPGVWITFYKAHTGVKSIPYEESVPEALCFGWVDSLVKRLDDDRYLLKFTPRKSTSPWSDSNRKRWMELKAAGLLAAAGFAAAPTDKGYAPKPVIPELPPYVAKALKANSKAWRFFQELPRGERRNFVVWIQIAKRPETRERRIRESIALLAAGNRLGLK